MDGRPGGLPTSLQACSAPLEPVCGLDEAEASDRAAPSMPLLHHRVREEEWEDQVDGESHLHCLKSSSAALPASKTSALSSEKLGPLKARLSPLHNGGKEKTSSVYQNICIIYKN